MTRCHDLADVVAPTDLPTFLAAHWEQRPLVIRHDRPDRYLGLFAIADLESAIVAACGTGAAGGDVSAVRSVDGTTTHVELQSNSSGRIAPASIHRAYAEGHTIIVNHLSRSQRPVAELCAAMEDVLQHPVGANLFLTPPDACGFMPHYDAMDTFFLQIDGQKQWDVWNPLVELPIGEGFPKPDPAELGAPALEIELEPGDALYLPRGWIHCGTTGPNRSLHLTFGVRVTRWLELLVEQVRRAAISDPRLRRSVPFGAPHSVDHDGLDREARALLAEIAQRNDASAVSAMLDQRLIHRPGSLAPKVEQIDRLRGLTLTTPLRRRPGLDPVVTINAGASMLRFSGGSISGPPEAAPALTKATTRERFTAADLPSMPDAARLDLARQLVIEGLVDVDELTPSTEQHAQPS